MKLTVNGTEVNIESEADTPLLWVLRDELDLVGTKYGCGMAQCGACTVHLAGQPIRSCVTPVSAAEGKAVETIEGQSRCSGFIGRAARLAGDGCGAMWLLPIGSDYGGHCAVEEEPCTDRSADRHCDGR